MSESISINFKILLLTALCAWLYSCLSPIEYFPKLPPGKWRGILYLDQSDQLKVVGKKEIELRREVSGQLPFLFEVKYDERENMTIEIINGTERIVADNVTFGRDFKTAKDTVVIEFSVYDCYIKAIFEEKMMEGHFHVNYRDNYAIPFKAKFGFDQAFDTDGLETTYDISGNWNVIFSENTENRYPAIAEFQQNGNKITGTFLTETGDYRHLYGLISGNKFTLATFDVAHAFLFEAKILEDGSITGIFRSGKHYVTDWSASRSENNPLKSPTQLTKITPTKEFLRLSLPDTEGKIVSLDDENFKNKSKILFITGSWCPNCKDMGEFLKEFYRNKSANLEIIAISFERYKDFEKQKERVSNYKEKMNYPFTTLIGGYFDKKMAADVFGGSIDEIVAYPTLLFLDKNNKIKGSYTGIYGQETSKFDEFKSDFQKLLNTIQ